MFDRGKLLETFAGAAALPEGERAAFLDRACDGDGALRAEVQSLLAAGGRRPSFMASPTTCVPAPSGAEAPGMRIGPYKLFEEIGHGGFGTVYMAEQESPVRRRVALKIIKLGMDTRAVVSRFEAERQALAMMDHPHIAKVHDAGATDSGRPYFVMELVRGDPITAYADRANLSIPERLELFVQVCQAVQHAHSKGVIHRDIKPGNVLVVTQDGRPHAKVIDFGIAKATDHRLTEKTLFTEFRQLIGTPEYMSPEQAGGAPDVDTRADVYGLGVLLYELLTGATPFDAKELRSVAYDEIQRIIREVDPPKPSTRLSRSAGLADVATLRRTPPDRLSALVAGDLDWIVMKALDKDRGRRYETASALAADIARHLAGAPVEAAPPSAAYRMRKFAWRNRGLVAASAAVAGTLLLGVAGTSLGIVRANRARAQEQVQKIAAQASALRAGEEAQRAHAAEQEQSRQRQRAERERDEARRITEFLQVMLRSDDPRFYATSENVILREAIDHAVRGLDEGVLKDSPGAERALRLTLARTYIELSRYDEARTQAQRVEALLGPEPANPHERAIMWTILASADTEQGKVESAEALYRRALALAEREYGADDLDTARARLALAGVLSKQDRPAEARPLVAQGLQTLRGATGAPLVEYEIVRALNQSALLALREGDQVGAVAFEREALAYAAEVSGEDYPPAIHARTNLGSMLTDQGRLDEAESVLRDARERSERVLGARHEHTGTVLAKLGRLARSRGQLPESQTLCLQALEILVPARGEASEVVIRARCTLAAALESQKDYAQAAAIRTAIDQSLPDESPVALLERVESLVSLGLDLRDLGNQQGAEATLRRAHSLASARWGDGHRHTWYRHSVASLLAFQIGFQRPASGNSERLEWLREAEPLLTDAAMKIDPPAGEWKCRKAAAERVVALYECMERLEPGAGHAAKAEPWRAKMNDSSGLR